MIWLLAFLACYRVTRLITADEITKPIRLKALGHSQTLGYLSTCDWCLSIWIAPFVATPVILWPDNQFVIGVLLWMSLSAGAGLISTIEGKLDR